MFAIRAGSNDDFFRFVKTCADEVTGFHQNPRGINSCEIMSLKANADLHGSGSNDGNTTQPDSEAEWEERLSDPSLLIDFCGTAGISTTDFCLIQQPWSLHSGPTGYKMDTAFPEVDYLLLRERQNKDFCEACLRDGVAHAHEGDYEAAKKEYTKGLEMDSENADLLVALGALDASHKGDYEAALGHLERALLSQPDHANGKLYRDQILQQLDRSLSSKRDRALRDASLEQALEKGRSHVTNPKNRGDAPRETTAEYPLLPPRSRSDAGSRSSSSRDRRRRKRHRKDKKKQKKHEKKRRKRKKRDRRSDDSCKGSVEESRRGLTGKRHRSGSDTSDSIANSTGTADSLEVSKAHRRSPKRSRYR